MVPSVTSSNTQIGELLFAAAAEEARPHRARALQRAARAAYFSWPEEAHDVAESGRSLTELRGVGPWIAKAVDAWLSADGVPAPDQPPLREGFLSLAEARATVRAHPEWAAALGADLQMHTTYSDGKASLREMVAACAATYGYRFVAVTDHSKGLRIARGMDEARLAAEVADIERVNEELAGEGVELRVLRGLEMNLSPEGEGDMEPEALRSLDLVLGAFHSQLRSTEDQTERYLRSLDNPFVDVLAHPRGRRFDTRGGIRADWERVVAEAAARDTALEIDAFPDRQDLAVELARLAAEAGARISIGTDAPSTGELRFMEFGLATAIRAGVPRDRILNFQPVEEVLAWASAHRD